MCYTFLYEIYHKNLHFDSIRNRVRVEQETFLTAVSSRRFQPFIRPAHNMCRIVDRLDAYTFILQRACVPVYNIYGIVTLMTTVSACVCVQLFCNDRRACAYVGVSARNECGFVRRIV